MPHLLTRRPRRRFAAVLLAAALTLTVAPAPSVSAAADATPARKTRTITLDGVKVKLPAGTRQVITVNRTSKTRARVTYWGKRDGRWLKKAQTTKGRIGYGGLVRPTKRKQGTGTTPIGTYDIPFTFGSKKRKASWAMPYRRFDSDDYWVLDNASPHYNRWRDRDEGEFRWKLPASNVNASERLAGYGKQYEMAAVIAYNYDQPVRYRGAGIFLHVNGKGATAGCVGVPRWFMRTTMHRLSPKLKPVIAIGR